MIKFHFIFYGWDKTNNLTYSIGYSNKSKLFNTASVTINIQRRFYSSKSSRDSFTENIEQSSEVAVKIYSNADTQKSIILKDNKDKSGIYR